jgi:hypothetical protein
MVVAVKETQEQAVPTKILSPSRHQDTKKIKMKIIFSKNIFLPWCLGALVVKKVLFMIFPSALPTPPLVPARGLVVWPFFCGVWVARVFALLAQAGKERLSLPPSP